MEGENIIFGNPKFGQRQEDDDDKVYTFTDNYFYKGVSASSAVLLIGTFIANHEDVKVESIARVTEWDCSLQLYFYSGLPPAAADGCRLPTTGPVARMFETVYLDLLVYLR
ncbi:hypothetical protein SFRURICE_003273 [Spodoptera frugiperda]|nr:hypothetical protein SFRURICE_003273 [Spodoptera frugiperda]